VLEAKPLVERTQEEKEAVRNHRKELKRKEKRTATLAATLAAASSLPVLAPSAPPPHSRSPSPQRDAGTPPVALALPLLRPSPPAASVPTSLLFVDPYHPSPSPVQLAAIAAASVASSSAAPSAASVAAASAMSSASKLRAAILKKRAAMSLLQPTVKRGEEDKEGRDAGQGKKEEKEEPTATEMQPDLGPGWAAGADEEWCAAEAVMHKRRLKYYPRDTPVGRRMKECVHVVATRLRAQAFCHGFGHDKVCRSAQCLFPDAAHPFRARDWCVDTVQGDKSRIQFCHWSHAARRGDKAKLLCEMISRKEPEELNTLMEDEGRFCCQECHRGD
jgi:hypothetical protein